MPDVPWPSVEGVLRLGEIAVLESMLCKTLSSIMGGSRDRMSLILTVRVPVHWKSCHPSLCARPKGWKMLLGWMN